MSIVQSPAGTRPVVSPIAASRTAASPSFPRTALDVQLVAVIIAVVDDEPMVRVVPDEGAHRLPSAAFRPELQPTLEDGLRAAVHDDTGLELGHVEQLQTMSRPKANAASPHTLSVGYLALAHGTDLSVRERANWQSCYAFFPWENWRHGKPRILRDVIEPRLAAWASAGPGSNGSGLNGAHPSRQDRMRICFGENDSTWDEEKVVERFDLLVDAGLVDDCACAARSSKLNATAAPVVMSPDHTRNLAAAMGRLRAKIKSRPLVFDLMPERFTLFELQRAVEAILGPHLHKQNFRRLVEHMGLVEPTDGVKSHTGGRPAKLFRFRQECLLERMQPGVRVRSARG